MYIKECLLKEFSGNKFPPSTGCYKSHPPALWNIMLSF